MNIGIRRLNYIIVCGGRDYDDRQHLYSVLDELKPNRVIQGGAKGADKMALEWCFRRMVECVNVPADWDKHGKAAGPIRNKKMIDENNAWLVVAFPGGRGTANMIKLAKESGLDVMEV